jgi:hypothetical protein
MGGQAMKQHVVMQLREAHPAPGGGVFPLCCLPVLGHDGLPRVYETWQEAQKVARRMQKATHRQGADYLANVSFHPGWIRGD